MKRLCLLSPFRCFCCDFCTSSFNLSSVVLRSLRSLPLFNSPELEMVELSEITYSQDECIAAVRDYYTFLTTMYLPKSFVIEPPEGGWPSITIESMKDLGKTDEVVSLLKHLPYMRTLGDGYPAQGAPWCTFADWQTCVKFVSEKSDTMENLKICSEGDCEHVNAHVVGLTMGGRDNPVFLLDTELGIVL
jgi:hypothetical protein